MKKSHFKQFGVVCIISIGMLLTNINTTFALTDDIEDHISDYNTNNAESTSLSTSETTNNTQSAIDDTDASDNTVTDLISSDTQDNNTANQDGIADSNSNSTSQDSSDTTDNDTTNQNHSDTADNNTDNQDDSNLSGNDVADQDDFNSANNDVTDQNDSNSADNDVTDRDDSNSVDSDVTDQDDFNSADNDVTDQDDFNSADNTDVEQDNSNLSGSETDIPSDSFPSDDTVTDDNKQTSDTSNIISDSTVSETAPTDNSQSNSEANVSHQETKPVGNNTTRKKDTNKNAVYIQPTYSPSELFVDIEDRIKYNTALPIDNIPSFITQEMIVGALKCQDESGYPASVTIAQIILESGFGKYGPGGDDCQGLSYLAYEYCNLFGIKGYGTAGSVDLRTGEQASTGEYYTITAGFRVYNTYTECIEDRTDLLKRVYSDLTEGVTDANTFASKIGSRWATSIRYSQNLISIMKQYDLYRLDHMTLKDFGEMIGKFADPCPGSYLTSSFGYRTFDNSFHKGIDLGTNGSPIPTYAAEAGTVIIAGYNASAGNWIVIDHGNGLVTKYMHHSYIFVHVGDKVEKGQQIGLTGNTGNSSGIHLHFQVEENGVAVDPTTYLNSYTE